MFTSCVKEAEWGTMAFVACSAPWFSESYTLSFRMYHAQCNRVSNARVQATLGFGAVNFRSFTVAWPLNDDGRHPPESLWHSNVASSIAAEPRHTLSRLHRSIGHKQWKVQR